jgi:hypothetical protein
MLLIHLTQLRHEINYNIIFYSFANQKANKNNFELCSVKLFKHICTHPL